MIRRLLLKQRPWNKSLKLREPLLKHKLQLKNLLLKRLPQMLLQRPQPSDKS